MLVFEGDARAWRRFGFEVVAQRGAGSGTGWPPPLHDIDGPALLIGMDTPQLTPSLLHDGLRALSRPDVDAVLGPTIDGGYWSIGFRRSGCGRVPGVPMSSTLTGAGSGHGCASWD